MTLGFFDDVAGNNHQTEYLQIQIESKIDRWYLKRINSGEQLFL